MCMQKPKKSRVVRPVVSDKQVNEFMAFIKKDKPELYPSIDLMKQAGLRVSDCLLIKRCDVVFRGKTPVSLNFQGRGTKLRQVCNVKVSSKLARSIKDAYQHSSQLGAEFLFCNGNGKRYSQDYVSFYLGVASMKILGVSLGVHYFRHAWFLKLNSKGATK